MKTVHMIGNAHLDPVWLWQWQEGFAEIKATFRSALDRMKEYDDFTFTSACASYYMWVEQSDPAMFEEIRARVAEGRWGLAGGWMLQPDCNIPSGESFARHALIAQRYFKEKFGIIAKTGYNVDSFGHNGNLPMILQQSGMTGYVFMRPMPHEKTLPQHLFRWQSRDGSEVLTYRIPWRYNIEEPTFDRFAEYHTLEDENTEQMAFYGVGNHGGGATVALLDRMHAELSDEYIYSTPDRFFAAQSGEGLPVITDDLQYHAKGCYSACSAIKDGNRRAENALLAAEKLMTLSGHVIGTPFPHDEWKRAWSNVLFNQFHDILGGCSIKEAYDDAAQFHGEAMAIAARANNFAAQQIAWNIDTIGDREVGSSLTWQEAEKIGTPIVVVNPHAYPVKTTVHLRKVPNKLTDEAGHEVPLQVVRDSKTNGESDRFGRLFRAEVPAFGWRVYHMYRNNEEMSTYASPFTITENSLANEKLRVTFDRVTGEMISLYDLESGCELLASAGKTRLYNDEKHDTWAHGIESYDEEIPAAMTGTITCIEQGPVRAIMRVVQKFLNSTLTREYALVAGSRELQVKVTTDFHEAYRILKFQYPADVKDPKALCQIPFGSIERPCDGTEQVCGEWLAMTGKNGGLAIATDSKHSFSASDNTLSLTALRSAAYADHFGKRDEFMQIMEQGVTTFNYCLFPYVDEADANRRAALLGQPVTAVIDTFHRGTLPTVYNGIEVSHDNVTVTAIKPAEDGEGFIFRCFEAAGRDTDVRVRVLGVVVDLTLHHNEVKTLLVKNGVVREVNFMEWEK